MTQKQKILHTIRLQTQGKTDRLAEAMAKHIEPGAVVLLSGGLAAGKTTFVRSAVAYLGSSDTVSSPTYTLANVYQSPRAQIIHIDAYRLKNPAEFFDLGLEEELERSIAFIEWGDGLADEFEDWIRLDLELVPESETARKATLTASNSVTQAQIGRIVTSFHEAGS